MINQNIKKTIPNEAYQFNLRLKYSLSAYIIDLSTG